jgi:CheY-like chemotaxis protein
MNARQPIIVVLDPDPDRATALSSRLDRCGYYVVRRSFGIDALQCVAEYHPSLVLSEVQVPDLDGAELVESILRISPSTQVRFIAREGKSFLLPQALEPYRLGLHDEADAEDEVVGMVARLMESTPLEEYPCQA